MFKKNRLYVAILGILFLVMTGCGAKALPEDEVGELFVDRLIYEKKATEFKEAFENGEILDKQMKVMTVSMQESFSTVFDSVAYNLTDEERDKIAEGLMERVRKTASYDVKTEQNGKDSIKVTYHIQGFDYAELVGQTMSNILQTGENFEANSQEAEQLVILSYFDALEKTNESQDIVDVTINFEKHKKKWLLSDKQDEDIDRLLLAFMSGTSSPENYELKVHDSVNKSIKEAEKRLK